jgi:YopX protein
MKPHRFHFRAWSPSQKKLVRYDEQDWLIEIEGAGSFNILRFHQSEGVQGGSWVGGGRDWVLMQSTGIEDKHGTEIFEGDIIEVYFGVGVVKYGTGTFDSGVYKYRGFFVAFAVEGIGEDSQGGTIFQNCEVIGNVWEHPERLK